MTTQIVPLALVELHRRTVTPATTEALPPAEPKGMITATVYYWNPDTGQYQTTAPVIKVGQEAGVRAYGWNTGLATQNMRMDTTVVDPDGLSGTLTGAVKTVVSGDVVGWDARWVCNKAGTYQATLLLYGEIA